MRPLAFGYMRLQPDSDQHAAIWLSQEIAGYANTHGFSLTGVFTEYELLATFAFAAIVDAVQHSAANTVLVPAMSHLGHLPGVQRAMKSQLERETGVVVVALHPPVDHLEPSGDKPVHIRLSEAR